MPLGFMELEMLSENVVAGALIFLLIIVGANFIMYAIARGWAKGGDARWIDSLKQGLSKPLDSQRNRDAEELRRKVEDLKKKEEKK
jgi:hypothetical protein